MKRIQLLWVSAFLFLLSVSGWSQGNSTNEIRSQVMQGIPMIQSNLENVPQFKKIEDQLSEVRRDQLNYKIEKDLLKEMYSSNLQIVNGGLAVFLTIVSLIGFLESKTLIL